MYGVAALRGRERCVMGTGRVEWGVGHKRPQDHKIIVEWFATRNARHTALKAFERAGEKTWTFERDAH